MPILRVQSAIPFQTNIPKDVTQNTWHFLVTGSIDDALMTAVHTALTDFYNVVDQYMPGNNLVTTRTAKFYDLGQPAPRAPLATKTSVHTYSAQPALPEEVAIVLSFQGDPLSGANQKRRRGRVYLGPFSQTVCTTLLGRTRVDTAVRTALIAAAQTLHNTSLAATGWKWCVYSRTSANEGGSSESWAVPVAQGWIDDAFDTQRRRGPAPSTRSTFT